jgi:hypothetical protein
MSEKKEQGDQARMDTMGDSNDSRTASEDGRISTRCPACGHQTLFIGSAGNLTCSWLPCKNPSVGEAIKRYQAIEQALGALVDNANGYDKSLVRVATLALKHPQFYDREYLVRELQQYEVWGRGLLASPVLDA